MGAPGPFSPGAVKALAFDIFGTVVDWRSSIADEGAALGARLGVALDWARLADDWRAGYQPAMAQVRQRELPWTTIDGLHRRILDRVLAERGLDWPEELRRECTGSRGRDCSGGSLTSTCSTARTAAAGSSRSSRPSSSGL